MSETFYEKKPWLAQYTTTQKEIFPEHETTVHAFLKCLEHHPDKLIIQYFDQSYTVRQVDEIATALAKKLIEQGVKKGDRLGLYAQNNPAFMFALLATWRIGGIVVPINPMNKSKELAYIINDAQIKVLFSIDSLYKKYAKEWIKTNESSVQTVICYSEKDSQNENDLRIFDTNERLQLFSEEVIDFADVLSQYKNINQSLPTLPALNISKDDVALLTYTSGTTGAPKGAKNTHQNILFNAMVFRDWCEITSEDVNLAIAPLFHITGMVAHATLTFLTANTLLLTHRFHPESMLDQIRRFKPTFTIGSITAFISLMSSGQLQATDFNSFKVILSGGAPVPAATAQQFEKLTGQYIYNAYGMTESASVSFMVPIKQRAPVDESSGALSIGVPVYNTILRVYLDDGTLAGPNEEGELALIGPQVMPGYWEQAEKTAQSFKDGFLLTGDVGFVDEQGWFYLIDRKKDMINVSGYKVWPRDVEDIMYGHPAVLEVAVVGVHDDYRGETVKAFISLKPGMQTTKEELIAFAKEQMASYKYPRIIEFMDDLPKTNTGKILRRALK